MTTKDRNFLLYQLATKEYLNTIMPHEIIQLEFIQLIRKQNGEIDRVLKKLRRTPRIRPMNVVFTTTTCI